MFHNGVAADAVGTGHEGDFFGEGGHFASWWCLRGRDCLWFRVVVVVIEMGSLSLYIVDMMGLLYLLGYGSSRSLPFCHGTDITASETEPNDHHLSMELFFWVGLIADSVRRLYQFHLSQRNHVNFFIYPIHFQLSMETASYCGHQHSPSRISICLRRIIGYIGLKCPSRRCRSSAAVDAVKHRFNLSWLDGRVRAGGWVEPDFCCRWSSVQVP